MNAKSVIRKVCEMNERFIITIIKATSVSVTMTVTEAVSVTGWPIHGKQT